MLLFTPNSFSPPINRLIYTFLMSATAIKSKLQVSKLELYTDIPTYL